MKKILLSFICLIAATSFAQNDFKILYGPYLQMVGENEATIMWVTSGNALSWVELAPNDGSNFYAESRPKYFQTLFGKRSLHRIHKVRITGLTKGTTYRYRICSKEVLDEQPYSIKYGKVAATDVYGREPLQFTTLDSNKKNIRFTVVNDIHGDNELLKDLTHDIRDRKDDFIIFNGDMVSHMDSEQQIFEGFLNTSIQLYASEIPFYYSRGNHETRGVFSTEFIKYFPTPTGLPYYAFKQGPVFFLVLDGGEDKPDDSFEYSETADFDRYRNEQAEWVKQITASEAFKQSPFKIAVIHIPPVKSTWHGPLHAKKTLAPLLNNAGIDLMLCAHLHKYYYLDAGQEGCNFPILINSNTHVTHIDASEKEMNIEVKDRQGKVIKTAVYQTKK